MFSIGLKNQAGKIVYKNIVAASCDLEASMLVIEQAKLLGFETEKLTVVRGVK